MFPCCFGMAPHGIFSFCITTMGIKITQSCLLGILYGSWKTNLKAFKLNGLTEFTTFDRTEHSQKYAFPKEKKRKKPLLLKKQENGNQSSYISTQGWVVLVRIFFIVLLNIVLCDIKSCFNAIYWLSYRLGYYRLKEIQSKWLNTAYAIAVTSILTFSSDWCV